MIEKARLKHRILSVMLAVVMVFGMLPVSPMTALAAETIHDFSEAKELSSIDGELYIDGVVAEKSESGASRFLPSGTYKLSADIETTTGVWILGGNDVYLDLNGYVWNLTTCGFTSEGILSLFDTSTEQTGKLTSSVSGSFGTLYFQGDACQANIYSGTIENTSTEARSIAFNTGYCSSNLYGGSLVANEYALYINLERRLSVHLDGTVLDGGVADIGAYCSFGAHSVIDVSDYCGDPITVRVEVECAGEIGLLQGVSSPAALDNFSVDVVIDSSKYDFYLNEIVYDEDTGDVYLDVVYPQFTQQPSKENEYTVAFNLEDATFQWFEAEVVEVTEKTVTSELIESGYMGCEIGYYEAQAGDILLVSTSSDVEKLEFIIGSEMETFDLTGDSKSLSYEISEGSTYVPVVAYQLVLNSGESADVSVKWVRPVETLDETTVRLSTVEKGKNYVCMATVGDRHYYSDVLEVPLCEHVFADAPVFSWDESQNATAAVNCLNCTYSIELPCDVVESLVSTSNCISQEVMRYTATCTYNGVAYSDSIDVVLADVSEDRHNRVDDVCTICGLRYYNIFVAGVELDSNNAADVLGDGTVTYDAVSNTLTLNGANINTTDFESYVSALVVNNDLNICLLGTNELTSKKYEKDEETEEWLGVAGIELNNGADLTITADSTGTLSVFGTDGGFVVDCDIFTFAAIAGDGGLIVNGGTLICGDQYGLYGGIRLLKDVVVDDGSVEAGFLAGANVTISNGIVSVAGHHGFPYFIDAADGMHGIYASNNIIISGGQVTVNAGSVGVVGIPVNETNVKEICTTHGLYAGNRIDFSGGTAYVSGGNGGYLPDDIGGLVIESHLLSPPGYAIYAPSYSISEDASFTCGEMSHKFSDEGVCEFCGQSAVFVVSTGGHEYYAASWKYALGLLQNQTGTVMLLEDTMWLIGPAMLTAMGDITIVIPSDITLRCASDFFLWCRLENNGTLVVDDSYKLWLTSRGTIINNGVFIFDESATFTREGSATCTETATHCYRDGACLICLECEHQYENGICARNGCYMPATDKNNDGVYEIGNAGQLLWFVNFVNGGNTTANAVLENDVDLTGLTLWTPITTYGGTFDGNGYAIVGMNKDAGIADEHRYGFIINLLNGGVVKNLTFKNASVFQQSEIGVGVITYNNAGTISCCVVEGCDIQLGNYDGLGFIAGKNLDGGIIENCAAINCTATRRYGGVNSKSIGGIVEINDGVVKNCYSYGCSFVNGTSANGAIIATGNAPDNCYYYTEATVDGTYGTAKTDAQFASGEIAFLLGAPFGQNIDNGGDNDGWPVISNATVYEARDCQGDVVYSNTDGETVHYPFDEPSFGWSYDWTECMAIITCSKCFNTVYYAECTVTVDTSDPSKTVYIASFTYNGQTYTNTQEIENAISVNISWGAMEFTYTDGEWQPESHTYADGKWTPDEEGGNVITVQNNGNMAVNVTFAYDKTVSEVEGSFTDESGNAVTSSVALAVDEEKKFKLLLSGKPNSALDNATLGSITVTILLPSEEEGS